jgi:hypothetical protein
MRERVDIESSEGLCGFALLDDPVRKKGTAFTADERKRFGIANMLVSAAQMKGVSQNEARVRVTMFDIDGLPNLHAPTYPRSEGARTQGGTEGPGGDVRGLGVSTRAPRHAPVVGAVMQRNLHQRSVNRRTV